MLIVYYFLEVLFRREEKQNKTTDLTTNLIRVSLSRYKLYRVTTRRRGTGYMIKADDVLLGIKLVL